jgi:hypothetical protein
VKRGAITHVKTLHLATLLRVRHLEAVGVLESLFQWTSQYAPRGDVGKFTNEHIARAIYWHGDGDRLVASLLEATAGGEFGWLEKHDKYRLVVHDWHEHADQTTRKYLQRKGLTFWNDNPARQYPDNVPTMSSHGPDNVPTMSSHGPDNVRHTNTNTNSDTDTTPPTPNSEGGTSGKELERLREQPELRGLTLMQWIGAKKCHPVEISEAVLEEIRNTAMMTGHVVAPGRFVEKVLSRLELTVSEKEKPRVWMKPVGGFDQGAVEAMERKTGG